MQLYMQPSYHSKMSNLLYSLQLFLYLGGDSIATRMDSDFVSIWNKGFQTIFTNGKFKKLCDNALKKHGKLDVF